MLRVRKYNLENNLIKNKTTLINITDVHSDINKLAEAVKYVLKVKPDVVTFAGDTLDAIDDKRNEEIFKILEDIAKECQVVICLGNHDLLKFTKKGLHSKNYFVPDYTFFNSLKALTNVKVLLEAEDEYLINDIVFCGFNISNDWYKTGEDKEIFLEYLDKYLKRPFKYNNKFRVLLMHSCNGIIWDNKLKSEINNINLVLSGHNHAGVTPEILQGLMPKNRGIIGPYSKWFMPSSYGYWTNGNTSVILSNGLTKLGKSHGSELTRGVMNGLLKCDIEHITLTNGATNNLSLEKIDKQKY